MLASVQDNIYFLLIDVKEVDIKGVSEQKECRTCVWIKILIPKYEHKKKRVQDTSPKVYEC